MKSAGSYWGASVGAMVTYTAAILAWLPVPLSYPTRGLWSFAAIAGEPSIRWFGSLAYAAAGAAIGMLAGRLLIRSKAAWHLVWIVAVTTLLMLAWHQKTWFTG